MKRLLLAALLLMAPASALAQTGGSPCPYIVNGAVLTAAQWNYCFTQKQDVLGYAPVNKAGDVMQGRLVTFPSNTAQAGFNVPPGAAPTVPVNGDVWTTAAGMFIRVNGTTIGPLSGGSGASFAATAPVAVSFPAGVATFALNYDSSLAVSGGNLGINPAHGNTFTVTQAITTTATSAFSIQATGSGGPAFSVNTSPGVGLAQTGLQIQSQAAGSGIFLEAISTGSNETLFLDGKGSGGVTLGALSTGGINIGRALTYGGVSLSYAVTGTGGMVLSASPTLTGTVTMLGGAASLPAAITGTTLDVGAAAGVTARVQLSSFGAISAFTGAVYGGTPASPTQVLSGTQLTGINAYAYTGSALVGPIASFRTYAAENIGASAWGSKACIATVAVTTTTLTDGLCQNSDGGITVASPTGGSKGAGTLNATALYINGSALSAGAASITVGTSVIASGTATRVLYDNAGVLGEYAISGSGNVAMTNSPTFTGGIAVQGNQAAIQFNNNTGGLGWFSGRSSLGANANDWFLYDAVSNHFVMIATAADVVTFPYSAGVTVAGPLTMSVADQPILLTGAGLAATGAGNLRITGTQILSSLGASNGVYTGCLTTNPLCLPFSGTLSNVNSALAVVMNASGTAAGLTQDGAISALYYSSNPNVYAGGAAINAYAVALAGSAGVTGINLNAQSGTGSSGTVIIGAEFAITAAAPLGIGEVLILETESSGGIFNISNYLQIRSIDGSKATNGILFGGNAFSPVTSSGCLICDNNNTTAAYGIRFGASSTFSTASISVPNFSVDGSGNIIGTKLQVGSGAVGTPSVAFSAGGGLYSTGANAIGVSADGVHLQVSLTSSNFTVQNSTFSLGSTIGTGAGNALLCYNSGTGAVTYVTSGPCAAGFVAITTQNFTTGGATGTYTKPAGVTWIKVTGVGAGGSGSGSGTGPGAGTAGGNTCWNTSGAACTSPVFQAGGGGGGSNAGGNGAGGTVSGSGTPIVLSIPGGTGGSGGQFANAFGGIGGASSCGVGTPQIGAGPSGNPGATATGFGNGGGGATSTLTTVIGGGGGGGGCFVTIISNPAATYTYAIGALVTGGAAGTTGQAGGQSSAGAILVEEHYNYLLKRDLRGSPANDNTPAFLNEVA